MTCLAKSNYISGLSFDMKRKVEINEELECQFLISINKGIFMRINIAYQFPENVSFQVCMIVFNFIKKTLYRSKIFIFAQLLYE
ncbi:hypothetical protein IGK47_001643 [Enterococcus sp. AZ007]